MILCVVDDLIFSVKISTAARAVGAETFFERNPEMVLARIREKQPALVIFDLNGTKLRPLETIAAMKSDPGFEQFAPSATCHTSRPTSSTPRARQVSTKCSRVRPFPIDWARS